MRLQRHCLSFAALVQILLLCVEGTHVLEERLERRHIDIGHVSAAIAVELDTLLQVFRQIEAGDVVDRVPVRRCRIVAATEESQFQLVPTPS